MSSINNTCAASYKKYDADSISLKDYSGNDYLFVRSLSGKKKGWFNIAQCPVSTDGRYPNRDGLVLGATWYSDEDVLDMLLDSEQTPEQLEQLERLDKLLAAWIFIRRSVSGLASFKRKVTRQKKEKEVAQ